MGSPVAEMVVCLLIAGILGGIVGWIARRVFGADETAPWRKEIERKDKNLADLKGRLEDLSEQLGEAESRQTAQEEKLTERDARIKRMEGELAVAVRESDRVNKAEDEVVALRGRLIRLEADKKANEDARVVTERELESLRRGVIQKDHELKNALAQVSTLTPLVLDGRQWQARCEALARDKDAESSVLRKRLAELELTTARAREVQSRLEAVIREKDAEAVTLRARVEELEPYVLHVKEWEVRYSSTVHDKDAEIVALHERIQELEPLTSQVLELESRHAMAVQLRDVEVGAIRQRVDELLPLAGQIKDWEIRLGAVIHDKNAEVEALRRRVAELEPLMAKIREQEGSHLGLLATKEMEILSLQKRNEETDAALAKLRERFTACDLELQSRRAEMQVLEKWVTDLEPVSARVKDLEAQLAVTTLDSAREIDALRARVRELEGQKMVNGREHASGEPEIQALRLRVESLLPAVQEAQTWQTRYESVVVEKDGEIERLKTLLQEREKVSERAPEKPASEPPPKRFTVPPPERDDLRAIRGIGQGMEKRLHKLGIYTFRQIAGWTDEDIEAICKEVEDFGDRIRRDRWVDGARAEHLKKYGERV